MRNALIVDDGKVERTRGQLLERVLGLASQLHGLGVERESRVSLALASGASLLEVTLAIAILGAVAAPLNHAYTEHEFHSYFDDLQPGYLVLPSGELAASRRAAKRVKGLVVVDLGPDEQNAKLTVAGRRSTPKSSFEPATGSDVALLLHTSGTTSRPKQVPLRHSNLMWSVRTIGAHYELAPEDVSYCLMPLFHVHGLVASAWAALAVGGAVVVPRRPNPRLFWAMKERVTWTSASPTIYQKVLDHPDADASGSRLRFIRSCSAALPDALAFRLEEVFGTPVLEAYGMTEASHQIASNPPPPGERRIGTVGRPTGTEILIVDESGDDVPPGQPGRVLIKGPGVTSGYLDNPAANVESFQDGWFDTGDLGSLDPKGYVRLVGRAKELINRGGENVSPYEVEAVLLSHPRVKDAVCYGVPDPKFGEVVAAAVVLQGEVTQGALREYCRERLATFKVPIAIAVLDAIPRTATGKLQRRMMASHLEALT
jgi:acyl-CoA synthetase (AMP-forming)/AMP-acid ligase II